MMSYMLSLLVAVPIFSSLLFLVPQLERFALMIGTAVSAVVLGLAVILLINYSLDGALFQFTENVLWIEYFSIHYHMAVDGISVALIVLTALITFLVLLVSVRATMQRPASFTAAILIMEGLMIGVFCARDVVLFYLFFEAMLIPMYLIIGIWGGSGRIQATLKFFLYTLFGSVFFLLSLLYLGTTYNSFDLDTLQKTEVPFMAQTWILFAFLLAFGIKVPMWPVHTWLPHAHVEAPTAGSVILAAITLKVGGYGMIRFMMALAPNASIEFAPIIIALSLIAIVYIGFVAIAQTDIKKLIAYSSIAHMGFVTLGLIVSILLASSSIDSPESVDFSNASLFAIQGAMFQMISHGLISAALFFAVGMLYLRTKSRDINSYGGLASVYPYLSSCMVLFALANCGLPGTSGFVGEFFVILSSFKVAPYISFFSASTLILGSVYSLWMIKRVVFGEVSNPALQKLTALLIEEKIVLFLLAFGIILLGVYPMPLLQLTEDSSLAILKLVITKI